MAYYDINHPFAAPVATRTQTASAAACAAPTTSPASGFSALEWSVIAIAQRDTLRSLGTPGRMSRALGTVFGLGTASRLADPKLEALRRIAVLSWRRGYAIASAEVKAFLASGYSPAFYELVVDTIAAARQAESRRRRI